jgi:hypothetical protein
MANEKEPTDWVAVAARALAYQSLHLSGLDEAPLVQRAQFLMTLGLSRAEAAVLLGSNDESLRVQLAKAKKKATSNGND